MFANKLDFNKRILLIWEILMLKQNQMLHLRQLKNNVRHVMDWIFERGVIYIYIFQFC